MSRRSYSALRALLVASMSSAPWVAAGPSPLEIPFNTTATMGPDGPWNFITLSVGSNPASNVSFFPLIENPNSVLVPASSCEKNSSLCQPNAEYYNSQATSAKSNAQQLNYTRTDVGLLYGDIPNTAGLGGNGYYWLERLNAPINFDNISSYIADNITGSMMRKAYLPISYLSLEQSNYQPEKLTDTSGAKANSTTLMEESYRQGRGGSFGLHMGAAMFGQSGSLHMGGYDSNRIIAPQMQMPGGVGFEIDTITFGTASGDSPPWLMPPGNFVTPASPGIGGLRILPHVPYIYLAREWCNAMAASLPVEYDEDTNLFLWQTDHPAYHDIITSPSYINFTFKTPTQFSIRVPFATLNLTLSPPFKDKPTQYFPCYGRQDVMALGRAFLQSVMWGRAWTSDAGYYYIAQAPGPAINGSVKPNVVSMVENDPIMAVPSNAPKWEDTWAGVLKPLNYKGTGTSSNGTSGGPSAAATASARASASASVPPNSSLSGGAIAGIVIGVLLATALLGVGAFVFIFRRRRQPRQEQAQAHGWSGKGSPYSTPPSEMPANRRMPAELQSPLAHAYAHSPAPPYSAGGGVKPSELGHAHSHSIGAMHVPEMMGGYERHEMPAGYRPAELADGPPPTPPAKDR